ncbi:MAG TPA: winged helix-turn-helix domain-containing protein [Candidatus Acidoferrum sp.]|nr:winged helix-turn-helix domain-containing protein [Candidatus Acidoferrum sp.]
MKSFQSFRLDTANHSLWRGQERVPIPPKAYDVLRYLVENPGRLISQDELLEKLWPETYVNPEVLRKYILDIRKILGDRPDKPEFIETVTKRGYRFIAAVIDGSAAELLDMPASGAMEEKVGAEATSSEHEGLPRKNTLRIPAIILVLAVFAAASIAGFFWFTRNKVNSPSLNDTSIAVLPFVDMSPGKDQEYFSDGLTEALINDLAKVPGLKVVARSSAFQFKGRNEDLRAVGQKLGVANILEGSVRKEGNRVRITAALTKAGDGFQLWSETYDREVSHIFAAQDEIASAVTGVLRLKLLSAGNAAIPASSRTTNSEAYQAYLQGQYFIARGQDKEDLDRALSYADQAIKLDAGYAPAWAQRSLVLERLARVGLIDNADGFRRARASAEKAIALDPGLAGGYLGLAMVQMNHDWDWEGADASLKKAGLSEPGSAAVLANRAHFTRMLGRVEEAIGLYKQAIALDPLRANFHLALGYELSLIGRYEEALPALQKAQELNPLLSSLHLTRGKILFLQGRGREAVAEMEKETGEWQKLSGEALAYSAAGRYQESDDALKRLIATHQKDAAYQIAEAYAYRGETDKAFQWLDRAFQQRDPGTPEMKTDPLMKSLRQDPRYAELLRKMRLPG